MDIAEVARLGIGETMPIVYHRNGDIPIRAVGKVTKNTQESIDFLIDYEGNPAKLVIPEVRRGSFLHNGSAMYYRFPLEKMFDDNYNSYPHSKRAIQDLKGESLNDEYCCKTSEILEEMSNSEDEHGYFPIIWHSWDYAPTLSVGRVIGKRESHKMASAHEVLALTFLGEKWEKYLFPNIGQGAFYDGVYHSHPVDWNSHGYPVNNREIENVSRKEINEYGIPLVRAVDSVKTPQWRLQQSVGKIMDMMF